MDKPLTELEKVAIFFLAIGPERAEVLLKRLGTDAMMQIAATMKRLSPVSSREKQAVLRELLDIMVGGQWEHPPGNQRDSLDEETKSIDPEDKLLGRVSDLFQKDVDVRNLNWEEAGYDFSSSSPESSEDDDENDDENLSSQDRR